MNHEQRQEYIRQVKQSFHTSADHSFPGTRESVDEGLSISGFWKARLIVSIIIFVCAVFVTNSNEKEIINVQEKVITMIQTDTSIESVQAWFQQQ